eukprot:CAMPEP_0116009902 /NCGR_PEP_ID=MMETSP0321-20121206/3698_1 /TAXON_ID=163516 /ORGANISM="Leptocylindrus danicus var. danicus, Strain B650" /LENGTH=63 /DNA_ID=CAMNT_0003478931 /DNA_START=933 /DNA_END=1120 /DNA_ORIENTATION=+
MDMDDDGDENSVCCSWQFMTVALGMRLSSAMESRGNITMQTAAKISATPNAFGDLLFLRREAG